MNITMPQKVQHIIHTIQAAGFEAYAVGGCVRDSLLERMPQDWDITTSAKPEQVKKLFARTVDTGIQHGTVTVLLDKEGFEVTTYRVDGEYEDSRHPKEVHFTASLREDLMRRDFTINAMAYNEETGLVDAFGGLKDMKERCIRCVGSPAGRFGEDALRIMRAIRFSAQLGYEIETETKAAVAELAPTLSNISAERIQAELVKLLLSPHPEYLRAAYDMGVTSVILPEFDRTMQTQQNNPHHCYNVGEHTLHAIQAAAPDKVLRLAMLFHDIAKPLTETIDDEGVSHFHGHGVAGEALTRDILHRLKFDNETLHQVCRLVRYHDYGNGVYPDVRIVRRAVNKIGEDLFPMLFAVRRADMEAQSDYQRKEKEDCLSAWESCYRQIKEAGDCVSLKTLAVTGRDLIEAGMTPGRELGDTLEKLLQMVIEEPAYNTREYLLSFIK